jgi:C1A family cysteine protease
MIRKIKSYGWKRDLPDQRDRIAAPSKLVLVPPRVDLRPAMPPPYDQGSLGSCTANAIAGAVQYERMREKFSPNFIPSRLFIYYCERALEGSIPYDSGAALRDGMKSITKWGVCPETELPYDVTQFTVAPTPQDYADATQYRSVAYQRYLGGLPGLRASLATGVPFVFGFSVYESFESDEVAQTGVVPMPSPYESMIGGHAVLAVGYDDPSQRFIVRNSWGANWGQAGYFTIPYAYVTNANLASDFWAIASTTA